MSVSPPPPPDLLSPEHIADPWPDYAVLRDHYPVHFDEALDAWLVSRYADIRPLLELHPAKIQELLGQYLADATMFPGLEGREHRRRRALLNPVFSRHAIEAYEAQIEAYARSLLEPLFERERHAVEAGLRQRGEMDFVTEFTNMFSVKTMCKMMDVEVDDYERAGAWLRAWIACEGNLQGDPEIIERALWAKEDFGAFIRPIIAERRASTGDDLISQLCHAELDGFSLSDEEVRSFVATMFLAGGETTDHQLGWQMHELAVRPDVQLELIEDPSLMANVLAEGMRYCAIVPFLTRPMVADVEIDGVKIKSGETVALMAAAGNRDPRRWQAPDEFDIHRSDLDVAKAFTGAADHLGFGRGPHFCIGTHLSEAEMRIALNVFFENARDVRLADGFEPRADPTALFIRALPNLKLSFALT